MKNAYDEEIDLKVKEIIVSLELPEDDRWHGDYTKQRLTLKCGQNLKEQLINGKDISPSRTVGEFVIMVNVKLMQAFIIIVVMWNASLILQTSYGVEFRVPLT